MISRFIIPLLMLIGAAAPFSVLNQRVQLFNRGGQMIQWEPRTVINSIDYPCPNEDFYPDPKNCSRFYQCVQFEVQGIIHSRYLFECLGGKVFDADAKTCVEGSCEPDVTDPTPSETTATPAVDTTPSESEEPDPATTEEPDATPDPADVTDPASTTAGPEDESESEGTTAQPDETTDMGESTTPVPEDGGLIEHTPEGRLCQKGRYIQHEKHCNFFQLCGEPNYYYACVAGTGFNEEFQMCRIAAQDESLCAGRPPLDMEITSASLLRQAFDWEDIGVLPDFDGSVFNAYPFVFTNIGVRPAQTTVYRFDAPPIRDAATQVEVADQDEVDDEDETYGGSRQDDDDEERENDRRRQSEQVRETGIHYFGLPVGAPNTALRNIFDKYQRTKERNSNTKPVTKRVIPRPLRGQRPTSTKRDPTDRVTGQNDYQGLATIPDLISQYVNLQDESLRQVADSAFIVPYLDDQVRSQYYDPSSSISPFLGHVQLPQFSSQTPGYRYPQVNPFTSGLSPYPISVVPLPYQALQQLSSPFGSFYSPFAPQTQLKSTPFSTLNAFRNAILPLSQQGYSQDPSQFGINSLAFPGSSQGLGYSSGYNPYEILNLDNRDLANLIELSQLSAATSAGSQATPQLQLKSPSIIDASSLTGPYNPLAQLYPYLYGLPQSVTPTDVSSLPSFEARTSEGDVFEFTPVSDETVLALASHGLLDERNIVGPDFAIEDLETVEDGGLLLASVPFYKKK